MLDYNEAKRFFAEKLAADLEGKGRIESAAFHTVKWAYLRGVEDGGLTAEKLLKVMNMAGLPLEEVHPGSPEYFDDINNPPPLEDLLYGLQVLHKLLADIPGMVTVQ